MVSKHENLSNDEWLKREAGGDAVLLYELVEREVVADELAAAWGSHNYPEGQIKYLEKSAQVEEIKADLGIDPLDQP
jgi:hypothetical protein